MINFQPVIIIGAPRSGTNMLRNAITYFDNIDTWPFDETNFIWKYGHKISETDELNVHEITNEKIKYVKDQFLKIAFKNNSEFVVEKTCANSLRVAYVDKILPNAKFIFIYRNGNDAIVSAKKKWKEGLDKKNIAKKVLWFNFSYLIKYILYKLFKKIQFRLKRKKYSVWGPEIENIEKYVSKYDLNTVCALQWLRCIELAHESLKDIDPKRIFKLKYEDFTENPNLYLEEILKFLGIDYNKKQLFQASLEIKMNKNYTTDIKFSDVDSLKVNERLSAALSKHGY